MGLNDGLYREFTSCQASRISFWMNAMVCAPSPGAYWDGGNDVFLSDSNGTYVMGIYNFDGAWAANDGPGSAVFLGACEDDTWVHFELVFDWVADTVDVYVNGEPVSAAQDLGFYTAGANNVSRIDLFHDTAHTEYAGWFDQIVLEKTCLTK